MITIEFKWFRTDDDDVYDHINAWKNLSNYCHNVDCPINIIEQHESLAIIDIPHTYPNVVSINTVYIYQENFGDIFPDLTHINFLVLAKSNVNFGKLKEVNILYILNQVKEKYMIQKIKDDTYKIYNVGLDAKDEDMGYKLKINQIIISKL